MQSTGFFPAHLTDNQASLASSHTQPGPAAIRPVDLRPRKENEIAVFAHYLICKVFHHSKTAVMESFCLCLVCCMNQTDHVFWVGAGYCTPAEAEAGARAPTRTKHSAKRAVNGCISSSFPPE